MKRHLKVVAMVGVALVWATVGCGDSAAPGAPSSSARATAISSSPALPVTSVKKDSFPAISVDVTGPTVGSERVKLSEGGGPEKLKTLIGALPKFPEILPVTVFKKAKLVDVVALLRELQAAGATKFRVTSETRSDLPKDIDLGFQAAEPQGVPPCALVGTITANFDTDVWPIRGGTARKHSKGMAGPDLSNAGETLKKELKACDASVAFFSADDTLDWEYAHMMVGVMITSDTEKKIQSWMLLPRSPVPGRPLKWK